jgi:hypothetical protein
MAVIDIGDVSTDYICDHAIPASSTYRWYLKSAKIKFNEPDKPLGFIVQETGITQVITGFTIGDFAQIVYDFKTFTHYSNWKKARGYWRKYGKKLYLVVKNQWGNNVAIYSPYDDPTTLKDWTGFISNIITDRGPYFMRSVCRFILATVVASTES